MIILNKEGCCNSAPIGPIDMKFCMKGTFACLFWILFKPMSPGFSRGHSCFGLQTGLASTKMNSWHRPTDFISGENNSEQDRATSSSIKYVYKYENVFLGNYIIYLYIPSDYTVLYDTWSESKVPYYTFLACVQPWDLQTLYVKSLNSFKMLWSNNFTLSYTARCTIHSS